MEGLGKTKIKDLRRLQHDHVSEISRDADYKIRRVRGVHMPDMPDSRLEPIIGHTSFWRLLHMGNFIIDHQLINALLERWRRETHTFHLPWGECTVTLQDVSYILGLPADGEPIITTFESFVSQGVVYDKYEWVQHFLGRVPPEESWKSHQISLFWLKSEFSVLHELPTHEDLVYFSRAYILRLLGGILLPGKCNFLVHIKYLLFLEDLGSVDRYSWGSAVLACLYRCLSRGVEKATAQIAGPMILLQGWIWLRMPFLLAHRGRQVIRDPWPLVFGALCMWIDEAQRRASHDLARHRTDIDQMTHDMFVWCPYVQNRFPTAVALTNGLGVTVWRSLVPLIWIVCVEWHPVDRVMRQFGMQQHMPVAPVCFDGLHLLDGRGRAGWDWERIHKRWVRMWNQRGVRLVEGPIDTHHGLASREYLEWYWAVAGFDDIDYPVDETTSIPPQLVLDMPDPVTETPKEDYDPDDPQTEGRRRRRRQQPVEQALPQPQLVIRATPIQVVGPSSFQPTPFTFEPTQSPMQNEAGPSYVMPASQKIYGPEISIPGNFGFRAFSSHVSQEHYRSQGQSSFEVGSSSRRRRRQPAQQVPPRP